MKKQSVTFAVPKKKICLLYLALCILLLAAMFLPIVSYKYKSTVYSLNSLDFLLGFRVCGGKVSAGTQTEFLLIVGGILLIAVSAVLSLKLRISHCTFLAGAGSLLSIAGSVVYLVDYTNVMKGAKSVKVAYGIYLLILVAILVLLFTIIIQYKAKVILMLDLMIIPGLIFLIINNYMPLSGLVLAFKNINYNVGIFKSPWCGFDNFRYLFSSGNAWLITRNTVLYNLVFIVTGNIAGLFVGVCLNECFSRKVSSVAQALILLPQLISTAIISYIVYGLLSSKSGWINNTFNLSISWYTEPKYWPFILTLVSTWMGLGYSATIYLSSIIGIDRSIYEAAAIDGCGKWRQIFKITIPLIRSTIIMLVLLSISHIMGSDFGLFYQVPMNSGALYNVTQTIDTYVYLALMKDSNYSLSTAANAYQAFVGFIIILASNALIRKIDRSSALM